MQGQSYATRRFVIIALVAISTTILAWTAAHRYRYPSLPAEQLDALRLVHHAILEDYVFARDGEELMYAAIDGMVASLDRYCRFVPPEEVRSFETDEITGTYEGIGVQLAPSDSAMIVNWPFVDGPAERAGVHVGDELLAADGVKLENVRDGVQHLLGPAGSTVRIRIRRGEQELELAIERGSVQKRPIRWARLVGPDANIGYLHIVEFQRGMTVAFDAAVERLRERAGGELAGLVVDLRSNPGGLLTEAVALSNRFLESGLIVSLKRRDGEVVESHSAEAAKCTLPELRTAVLIDRNSASASEVFCAALQDHDRASLVGERTYGKGVVQQIYSWPNRDFRLKMTSSHYYTPNGRNISKTLRREDDDSSDPGGIDPDVAVPLTREIGIATAHALGRPEPPEKYSTEVAALAERLGVEFQTGVHGTDDACLAAAIELLRAPPAEDGR
ncbi:MAG: S41 family peptidase [Planctomycetes bacterium]|nr:S41 family peptidase [Planctomycetota bacterium]